MRRERRGLRIEMRRILYRLVARRLQRVDAQVDRRARSQRPALGHRFFREGARENRRQPFRIIAGDMVGRAIERGIFEPAAFFVAERSGA